METQTLRSRSWSPALRIPVNNIPVIAHPMSQMGSCGDLSVRGVSTPVLRREKTISFVDKGRADTVSKENRYYINDEPSRRLLHWPLDYQQRHGSRYARQNTSPNFKGISGEDLVDKIRDKLTTGFYGVRHMFKSNDPMGKGSITKEALLRVLYHLCGYFTKDQYDRLLERLDLEDNNIISFTEFIRCFQDNETVRRQWIIPNKKMETRDLRRAMYPEENLRNLENMHCDPHHSAPYATAFLRDKLNTGSVNIRDILPTACFQPNGMIISPQLREALAQLDVYLTDIEFDKLWSRFDRDNSGAVYTKQFYKLIGLTSIGQPKITTTAVTTSKSQKNAAHQSEKSEIVTTWSTEERDGVRQDVLRTSYNFDVEDENTEETKETKVKQQSTNDIKDRKIKNGIISTKPPVPPSTETSSVKISRQQKSTQKTERKIENVVESLHSKYEEPYNYMFEAFKLFDYLDDGYVSKVDFRRVLKEFGIPIAASDLNDFLNNCGIRPIRGQICFQDFLQKYQNHDNNGILNDILSNDKHVFQSETKTEVNKSTKCELVESSVVEHLHGDFLKLVNEFREVDTMNEGKITQETFKRVIEKQLGGALTEKQWKVLKKDVGMEPNGLISYPGFLAKFQNEPKTWNKQQQLTAKTFPNHGTSYKSAETVMDRLRHMATYMMKVKETEEFDDRNNSITDIHRRIENILRSRFHTFDKHYKDMDRKMTGRMTKWQFGALLRLTGLTLQQPELDKLWGSLKLAPDGMIAYSSLIQQYNPACLVRTAWASSTAPYALDDTHDILEQAKLIQEDRRNTAKLYRPHSAPSSPVRPNSSKRRGSLNLKTDTSKLVKRKEIMKRLQPIVAKNWEKLQQNFVRCDKQGYSNIGYMEMRGILLQLQFGLSNQEITEILDQFDLHGNGRFHYIAFLEACYPQNGDFEIFEEVNELDPNFIRKCEPEIYDKFNVTNAVYKMREKLLREWQNLRRAFRKMDSNNDGYLEVGDFKKCLKLCNIDGSDEDLYHLFSQFDNNLTGKIAYKEFLKTLLSIK